MRQCCGANFCCLDTKCLMSNRINGNYDHWYTVPLIGLFCNRLPGNYGNCRRVMLIGPFYKWLPGNYGNWYTEYRLNIFVHRSTWSLDAYSKPFIRFIFSVWMTVICWIHGPVENTLKVIYNNYILFVISEKSFLGNRLIGFAF